MPKKLDDEIARIHMVVAAAWAHKVDEWRRRNLTCLIFRKPSGGWWKWGWKRPSRSASGASAARSTTHVAAPPVHPPSIARSDLAFWAAKPRPEMCGFGWRCSVKPSHRTRP